MERKRVVVLFRVVVRALLAVWAAGWSWFVLAVAYGGAEASPPAWIPAAWLLALAALVGLAWTRPAVGGLVLVAAGIAAAASLDHPGARALLAGPPIALGLACLALRPSAIRSPALGD